MSLYFLVRKDCDKGTCITFETTDLAAVEKNAKEAQSNFPKATFYVVEALLKSSIEVKLEQV